MPIAPILVVQTVGVIVPLLVAQTQIIATARTETFFAVMQITTQTSVIAQIAVV